MAQDQRPPETGSHTAQGFAGRKVVGEPDL